MSETILETGILPLMSASDVPSSLLPVEGQEGVWHLAPPTKEYGHLVPGHRADRASLDGPSVQLHHHP